MSDIAIRSDGLSKRYRIGSFKNTKNLREAVKDVFKAPLRPAMNLFRGRAKAVSKPIETIWALSDVSFEIKKGDVVGIIGSNGSGKSTLLKIISRITEPTAGSVEIGGRVGSLLEVGTGFHQELTGRENIYLNGAILGMKKEEIKRQFDEIVDFSEVEKFIDTPVKHYSSGMYLRLAFAVAAHLKPEVLLVDEVLAVGDADFQKKCLGKMDAVSKEGRTILFVSHNMAAIANLCSKAILLHQGKLLMEGETRDVIDEYTAGASALAKTELALRKDRRGNGIIKITAIQILNQKKEVVANGVSGQELTIRMYYQAIPGQVFKNCRASIAVVKNEQMYFNLSTEMVSADQMNICGDGYLDFTIPELPLSQSTYMLHSFIEANKEVADWVADAAELSVIDGDYYGTGKNYPVGWRGGKGVLIKFSWTQQEDNSIRGIKKCAQR
jgi:lipopolysaccharide transport system ATP-binding protein